MARDLDVLDFSAGLGDLARYLVDCGAATVIATTPDQKPPDAEPGLTWVTDVAAGVIAERLAASTFDLAVARMVFQFPTWEGDRADPDTMIEEFAQVLRPRGRLVIAFHEFKGFEPVPARGPQPSVAEVLAAASGELAGLARLVRFLDLPPREGPLGETGFGLKVPMLVTSLHRHGFEVEIADHAEPFTFPLDLDRRSDAELAERGVRVTDLKRRYLSDPEESPYQRPGRMRRMLMELEEIMPFVAWPIVRIVARLAG